MLEFSVSKGSSLLGHFENRHFSAYTFSAFSLLLNFVRADLFGENYAPLILSLHRLQLFLLAILLVAVLDFVIGACLADEQSKKHIKILKKLERSV